MLTIISRELNTICSLMTSLSFDGIGVSSNIKIGRIDLLKKLLPATLISFLYLDHKLSPVPICYDESVLC